MQILLKQMLWQKSIQPHDPNAILIVPIEEKRTTYLETFAIHFCDISV